MTVAAIVCIGIVFTSLALVIWKGIPADAEEHRPLVLQDGSQVQLAGGRVRLRANRGDGGFVGGGGGDGGGGGCS